MKKLLYVCEVDSGGITEYSILQCEALTRAGLSVCFLCKSTFPKDRFSRALEIIEFEPVEPPAWAFGKLKTIWRMTVGLNRYSQQIRRIAEERNFEFILFAFYKEYFSPFWIGPLNQLKNNGCAMGTIAHDPVRDFVIGPKWWHRFCVRRAFSFLTHVFVHDDTPVDFGGKRPEGIAVHQIPHGPYEVADPKIGRLEMRRQLGFLTTDDSDIHGWGTTKITKEHEREEAGLCLDKPSGAAFSNPSTSELARDVENALLTRSASGPASALRADNMGSESAGGNQLADSKEVLEGQSQAGLQMDSQKLRSIRAANDPSASEGNSSSVPIRVISGEKTSGAPQAPSPATSHSPLATPASPDVVFLAFGQIRDGKNLDLFLRAMTRLPENVKLLVAGKGDSGSSRPAEYYQKLAEELGVAERCRWDIRRIPDEEVGDIFAACDVVLVTYSAKFRSASGVLNAAISARKPALASAGPGPLKTVVEKYHLGEFVNPDDAEEILRGAQMILDSLPPLDSRRSTLDSAKPLATSTLLNPEWEKYEQENSWGLNAQLVAEAFFLKPQFVT